MRILVVGTGGVGSTFAAIAQRRDFFERITLADLDRPAAIVDRLGEPDRFAAAALDASRSDAIAALIRGSRADAVLNSIRGSTSRSSLPVCRPGSPISTWR